MKKNYNFIKLYLITISLTFATNTLVAQPITSFSEIPYVEYKDNTPELSWETRSNSCVQTLTLSGFSNLFSFAAHTGKNALGIYTIENIKNSKRSKLTLYTIADSGMNDCFQSSKYDNSGKTIVLYILPNLKNNTLNVSNSLKGDFVGFYTLAPYSLLTKFTRQQKLQRYQHIYNTIVDDLYKKMFSSRQFSDF